MADLNELKQLAHEVTESGVEWLDTAEWRAVMAEDWADFVAACAPETILALIAENERLSEELSACTEAPGGCGYWREAAKQRETERDQLRAEMEECRHG